MTLKEILPLARAYGGALAALGKVVEGVREEQRRIAKAKQESIQSRVAKAAAARAALVEAITANPALFERPRTQAAHGVTFGMRKLPGRIVGDPAKAIALIEKTMPAKAAELVRTKKELDKGALLKLSAAELASLGVGVADAGDAPVAKAASGDLDKLVKALLEDFDG